MAEMLNQTQHPLLYERAVFFGGAMHSAPDLRVEPGQRVYWTSGQGVGMDLMRGNLSAVIFTVGPDKAELLLVTHLSRLQVNPQCVGVRIGAVGTFTAMGEVELRAIVEAPPGTLTTSYQKVSDVGVSTRNPHCKMIFREISERVACVFRPGLRRWRRSGATRHASCSGR